MKTKAYLYVKGDEPFIAKHLTKVKKLNNLKSLSAFEKKFKILNNKIVAECDFQVKDIHAGNLSNEFDITKGELEIVKEANLESKNINEVIGKKITFSNILKYGDAEGLENVSTFNEDGILTDCKNVDNVIQILTWDSLNIDDLFPLIAITPNEAYELLNKKRNFIVRKEFNL
jgi:hypothetical protein